MLTNNVEVTAVFWCSKSSLVAALHTRTSLVQLPDPDGDHPVVIDSPFIGDSSAHLLLLNALPVVWCEKQIVAQKRHCLAIGTLLTWDIRRQEPLLGFL